MERQPQNFKKSSRTHLLLGFALMFLGLFLIADLADIVPWRLRDFIFTWQALLILIGLVLLSNRENKGAGIILIAIGSFFLLPRFVDLPHYWRGLFWPSMLIIVGLVVIFSARNRTHRSGTWDGKNREVTGDDLLDDVAIFGGGDKVINSQNFQGGKITNIFGGSKYDMSGAKIAPGKNYLEVVMIFGGSKFIVPEDWNVQVKVTPVFGGFSDKRVRTIVERDTERTLIITGPAIFGGGELVNYV